MYSEFVRWEIHGTLCTAFVKIKRSGIFVCLCLACQELTVILLWLFKIFLFLGGPVTLLEYVFTSAVLVMAECESACWSVLVQHHGLHGKNCKRKCCSFMDIFLLSTNLPGCVWCSTYTCWHHHLDLTLGILLTGGTSNVCGNNECLKNCEAAKKQLPVWHRMIPVQGPSCQTLRSVSKVAYHLLLH